MPAPGMIFAAGPAQVACDRSGQVTWVRHRRSGDLSYLSGAGLGALQVDGAFVDVPAPEVLADVDEVEFVHTLPGQLRVVVRHSFSAGWGLRVAFTSLSDDELRVDRAELALQPGTGCVAWALALGATAAYSVSPASGTGPLLGARLRLGSIDRVTERGLELSSFTLRPEGRYVVQLDWDWYARPRDATDRLSDAPSALFVTTGESVQFRVDEDVAVVEPAGVQVDRLADRVDVVSPRAGSYPFELRSARGTTAFDLQWVDPVGTTLAGLVPRALSGPRTAAGVIKLASVAEALLIQHALAVGAVDDLDVAAEALDLFTARLGEPETLSPLEAAYLCREFDRTGDADLLTGATDALVGTTQPSPGIGLAATQLCLGLIVSGRPVEPVLAYLSRLVAAEIGPDQPYPQWSVSRQSAALELVAVTHAGPGAAGVPAGLPDLTPRIAGLGLHLGAGLRGRAVSPLPTDQLSHLITVFQLLPEGLSGDLRRRWGHSPQTLARLATPELLARLEDAPVGDAHAWLLLAPQPG